MIDIEKLQVKAESATQGPWRKGKNSDDVVADNPGGHEQGPHEIDYYGGHLVAESMSSANREFVADASPATVLELIARIKRLSDDNKAKNGSLAAYGKQISALQKAVKNRDRVLEKVSAERDKLKGDNDALRKDAARLDWLQKPYDGVSGCENMARNQIDAAMSKEAGHE